MAATPVAEDAHVRAVDVVVHTHWDREWYLPFEEFLARLVPTVDLVLELLEDPRWTHFHLDGQTTMIDDYLAVRPEREADVRSLVGTGRLSCGPWVTLVDEFLVSGESLVRNLEDGMARAEELGGAGRVAYLPDQFGHIGQMPQLLASAGLEWTVVWRGVPASVTGSSFRWISPDGSEIKAAYLPFGYAQGEKMPAAVAPFIERVARELSRLERFVDGGEPALLMVGSDHERPEPAFADLVEAVRAQDLPVRITSLERHLERRDPPAAAVRGELRSAARANLLPNTYSVRFSQKIARARAEHALERYAEPLAALIMPKRYPYERLAEAWHLLHLNGAHDSVCGCSTDEVAAVVDARTAEAQRIADEIARGAVEELATRAGRAGVVAFNPSPFARRGIPGLSWSVLEHPPRPDRPVDLSMAEGRVQVSGSGAVLSFEDTPDRGDLYTFCPAGRTEPPRAMTGTDGRVVARFDSCEVSLSAARTGEGLVRLDLDIDNRRPDHRLRLLLHLPETARESGAGAPFEIVRRPPLGAGGTSEPPSGCFPARGFVAAGGGGFLSEGVFEYELADERTLAFTLLRCVGTISRAIALPTRRVIAGPDVATPGAQMLGRHHLAIGLLDGSAAPLEAWERFALPLMLAPSSGGGDGGDAGRLLDLDAPAMSAVRLRDGRLEVRVWNPGDDEAVARLGGARVTLGPRRIETLTRDLP